VNHASAYQKSSVSEGLTVEVTFSDGRKGTVDLRDALRGPMFAGLRVDDELETIVWPNGADLAPEYVYFRAFRDEPGLQELFVRWGGYAVRKGV
jgi:hypothetical protein